MGKRELVALLSLSSRCLMIVVWLLIFFAVPRVCPAQLVIVVSYSLTIPGHMYLHFCMRYCSLVFASEHLIFVLI